MLHLVEREDLSLAAEKKKIASIWTLDKLTYNIKLSPTLLRLEMILKMIVFLFFFSP